jgi:TAG lipase/steryl ester hydrolase/phospholipase A2/LPA acyltransferase
MQQLSEMFNINHFIISQANPHAYMFASYSQKRSVWKTSLSSYIGALLTFLKDQVRSWLVNLSQCLGARRIAPLFETNRLIPIQFFTQEYEGRSSDISLCPWSNHRSLFSALMHIIYNPSEAEFRDWIQAAERETWKHIPSIKSHIAEEMTLDRCVQRLRRRLLQESWQKRNGDMKTTGRVPSFFTSPSLTNMGGLNILDQPPVEGIRVANSTASNGVSAGEDEEKAASNGVGGGLSSRSKLIPTVDIQSGWGGLGLKGNRSSGNLMRSSSDASGLFIDDEGNEYATRNPPQQSAGEHSQSVGVTKPSSQTKLTAPSDVPHGYLKTTSMAQFYYRKSYGSAENLRIRKVASSEGVTNSKSDGGGADAGSGGVDAMHQRRKSRSHADLVQTVGQLDKFNVQ